MCERTATRLLRWLRDHGLITDEPDWSSNESPEVGALEACARGSLGVGELVSLDAPGDLAGEAEDPLSPFRRKGGRHAGEALGFHLDAGVAVPAHNRLGREILLRYCARPPVSLERISVLPDGRKRGEFAAALGAHPTVAAGGASGTTCFRSRKRGANTPWTIFRYGWNRSPTLNPHPLFLS